MSAEVLVVGDRNAVSVERRVPPGLKMSLLLLGALIVLFVGERVIGEGSLRGAVSGIGVAGALAAIAWRVQLLGRAPLNAKGIEKRILYGYLTIACALFLYVLSTPQVLGWLHLSDSATDRLRGTLRVLWPAIMLLGALAVLFVEKVYLGIFDTAHVDTRRVRQAMFAGLSFGFAIVFLFTLNYVVADLDVKRDLSYFKTTRPSETSVSMAASLDEPVRAVLFFSKGSDVLARVEPFFRELDKASDQFKLVVMDHAMAPKLVREQRVRGNGNILMIRGEEGKATKAEQFLIGTDLESSRSKLRTLDARFQQVFSKLVLPPRSIHLTAGHGERTSKGRKSDRRGDRITTLKKLLRQINISTDELGIAQGLATDVSDSIGAVAITGPREQFLPEEAASLLRYVQRGGRLLLTLDPNVETGLEPLLAGLGLEIRPGVLASTKHFVRRTRSPADRAIVYSNAFSSHPTVTTVSRNSKELAAIFIQGGGLARMGAVDKSVKVTFPLRSPSDVWRDLNANYERDGDELIETANMMAAVTVKSKNAAREGRAVVIADGDFLTDQVLGPNPGNLYLSVDTVRWLVGEEKVQGALTSEEDIKIEHTRDEDRHWFYLTSFAVPIPIAILGFWIGSRRRRRSRQDAPGTKSASSGVGDEAGGHAEDEKQSTSNGEGAV